MRRENSEYPRLGVIHAAILAVLGRPLQGQTVKAADLARTMDLNERVLLLALGNLAAAGLTETHNGRWRLSPTGQALVDDNTPAPPPADDPAATVEAEYRDRTTIT